ncbi:cell wall integrity and stress response component 1 [Fusarium subglutinans]|uniref:Cell wall integrity and stress response component 1 n=1 Tax=Gibberella subglutinans TaxID=42677 RepID=A0A8H5QF00_GIBSU|nr:cell wall integrity and stress response component 1 [Fusarium subglutinans]KAF5613408.1 cell wall integrity and stress response component 1 [Fusarium subglutinans]
MKTSGLLAMVIAGASFVIATELQEPAQTPVLNQQTRQGCFKSVGNMTQAFSGTHTSSGYCFNLCKKKYNAFALQGSNCYCGMLYPPDDDLVDDDKCNWPCPAYPKEACGALRTYYSVFNTGLELAPDSYKPEESTTSAAPSSTKAAESTTAEESAAPTGSQDAATTSEAPPDENKKSGPNVAAIAAGVVVGVVVVAAIGGGAIFFVRRRRNAEIEEEHRRNAAVNAFINGSKPPGSSGSISMTDSRLDPVMAHRRLSDGSIADNQDYSRRILRVTNA